MGIDILGGVKSFVNDIGNSVSSGISSAEDWMREKADEARGSLSNGYREIMDTAISKVKEVTPDFMDEAVETVGGGYAAIGSRILDFLDPVSYGLELGADVIDLTTRAPGRRIDAVKQMFRGDVEGGLTALGKDLLDQTLLQAQLGSALIPGGHVAGKAAKVPLKAARKELKTALKSVPKGSAERKAIKSDLRINSAKKTIGVSAAKNSGRLAKAKVRSDLDAGRQQLGVKQKVKFTPLARDWDALMSDLDPTSPLMKEGDAIWQKQTRKNSKRK